MGLKIDEPIEYTVGSDYVMLKVVPGRYARQSEDYYHFDYYVMVYGTISGDFYRHRVSIVEEDRGGWSCFVDDNVRSAAIFSDSFDNAVYMAAMKLASIIPCPMLRIMLQVQLKCYEAKLNLDFDLDRLYEGVKEKQRKIWLESDFPVNLQIIN